MAMTMTIQITCDNGCDGPSYVGTGADIEAILDQAEEASWRVRWDPAWRRVVMILCPGCAERSNLQDRITAAAIGMFLEREAR